jgi:hypothetical protein
MARTNGSSLVKRNGQPSKPAVSKLGRDLRKISDRIAASGLKPLSRREIEREVKERRGAR